MSLISKSNHGSSGGGNSDTSPGTQDMSMNGGQSTITVLPPEENGETNKLKQNNEKIEKELNDLYGRIYEEEIERDTLWAEFKNSITKMKTTEELYHRALSDPYASDAVIRQRYRNWEKAQQDHGRVNQLYHDQKKKVDEMNRRITQLETGFDVDSFEYGDEGI